MRSMGRRPMIRVGDRGVGLACAHVRSDALALMGDFDGRGRGTHFDSLPRQLIRHAVGHLHNDLGALGRDLTRHQSPFGVRGSDSAALKLPNGAEVPRQRYFARSRLRFRSSF